MRSRRWFPRPHGRVPSCIVRSILYAKGSPVSTLFLVLLVPLCSPLGVRVGIGAR